MQEGRHRGVVNKLHEAQQELLKAMELLQMGNVSLARSATSSGMSSAISALKELDEMDMIASEILEGVR